MTTIPTDDVAIDDIEVCRVTYPRTNKPPIVVRYAGAVCDVIQGPTNYTWGPRELVLSDRYGMHRVGGDSHDAIAIERSGIRPTDVKTSKPDSGPKRTRNGCFILRENQHEVLKAVPRHLRAENGFVATGDYVCAVYETIEDMIILLDDCQISARDLDRMTNPSFYSRGDAQCEASVEWTDVPGLSAETMYARLDAAPTYLRALGEDPDAYRDDLARVRDCVAEVEAEQANHGDPGDKGRQTEAS